MAIGLENKAVKAQHMTELPLHHDEPGCSLDSIPISIKPACEPKGLESCAIPCPASSAAFSGLEADVRNEQHEPFSETILKFVGKEEPQQQYEMITDSNTTNTRIKLSHRQSHPLPNSAIALGESSLSQGHHRYSKVLPRYERSSSRSNHPDPRRTQSLGSNIRSNDPNHAMFASRKKTAFAFAQPQEDGQYKAIAQDRLLLKPSGSREDKQRLGGQISIPPIVIQETWHAKEYTVKHPDSSHKIKSENHETPANEAALSPISKSLSRKDISIGEISMAAEQVAIPQNEVGRINIEVDLATIPCIGRNRDGSRCNIHINKANRKKVRDALESFSATDLSKDRGAFSDQLEPFVQMLFCVRRHQYQAPALISTLKEEFSYSTSEEIVRYLVGEIRLSSNSALQSSEAVNQTGLQTSSSNFDGDYIIRKFVPYDPATKRGLGTTILLQKAILRNLTPRELHTGFIYIYWFPGNFGYVKIGVTTRQVEKRLSEWAKQCGHGTYLEYPKLRADEQPVPHVYRVEALVQAELGISRKIEVKCSTCGKNHKEWFEQPLPDAIAAVKKWSAWMRTAEPYVEEKGQEWDKKSQKMVSCERWVLKNELRKDIQTLCEPTPKISSPSQKQRQKVGRSSTEPGVRVPRARSRSSIITRSKALQNRSKTELPDDPTTYPRFSEKFLKAPSTEDDGPRASAA